VTLAADSPLLGRDPAGLPIHGVIPGNMKWALAAGSPQGARIAATLDWREPALLEVFPFPHRVDYEAELGEETLTVAVTVHAGPELPVPVCFGFHPYLALPAGSRAGAEVSLAVKDRLLLDRQMLPTGGREPFEPSRQGLGARGWDDAFAGPELGAGLTVFAGEAEAGIEILEGFCYSQVFAPADADFVCLEPMTAPTNALASGSGLTILAPGERFRACFRVRPALT
jgi:aldose 1-epimerase